MGCRAFILLGLLVAVALLISSEVGARDLAETSTEKKKAELSTETGDTKSEYSTHQYGYGGYPPGGYGGYPPGGYGGYPPGGYGGYPPRGYGGYPPGGYGGYPPRGYGGYPPRGYGGYSPPRGG